MVRDDSGRIQPKKAVCLRGDPNVAESIRVNAYERIAADSLAKLGRRRHPAGLLGNRVKTVHVIVLGPEPESSFGILPNFVDAAERKRPNPLRVVVIDTEAHPIVATQTIAGCQPDEATPVLNDGFDKALWQAVAHGEVFGFGHSRQPRRCPAEQSRNDQTK